MKKKLFVVMMAIVAMFTTSCQLGEGYEETVDETSVVAFNLSTPEISTRGYGDGANATVLQYAVYDAAGIELTDLTKTDGRIDDKSTTVTLQLTTGNTYSIIFWAAAPNAPYNVDFANKTMTVDYDKVDSNSDDLDAFYAYHKFTVSGVQTETVTLKRPFAQLNIGTSDYAISQKAGYVPTQSSVTVKQVYSTLNLKEGTVSTPIDAVFKMNAIDRNEKFPVAGNEYLAMNYLLVPADKSLVDIEFTHTNGSKEKTYTVEYVPVQRNYRSNIYGDILTSNVNVNVEIRPDIKSFVTNSEELAAAITSSGTVVLQDNITPKTSIDIKAGVDVYLDLNGKNIIIDPEVLAPNGNSHYAFIVREGGSLVIDGDGTVETTTPAPILFYPAGDVVIENGTFIRNIPEGYTGDVGSMFVGTKPTGGWESTGVTIKGGYFDSGYYDENAADIEDILAGNKDLEETEDDIKKRGVAGDKNKTRVALKNNTQKMFNRSNNYFKIYGGTFVGANPAWGDEGCMLPTTPQYLRPWSYYQGALLDGQTFHEDGIVLPDGYVITKGTAVDGRPTYTVTYSN